MVGLVYRFLVTAVLLYGAGQFTIEMAEKIKAESIGKIRKGFTPLSKLSRGLNGP